MFFIVLLEIILSCPFPSDYTSLYRHYQRKGWEWMESFFLLWFLIAIQLCIPLTRHEGKQKNNRRQERGFSNNPFYNSNLKNRNTIRLGKPKEKRKKIYILLQKKKWKTYPIFLIAPKWFISCSMLGTIFSSPAPSWII